MDPPDGNDLYDANCLGSHSSPDPQNIYPSPSAPRKVIGARECLIKGAIYGTYVFKGGVKPDALHAGILHRRTDHDDL